MWRWKRSPSLHATPRSSTGAGEHSTLGSAARQPCAAPSTGGLQLESRAPSSPKREQEAGPAGRQETLPGAPAQCSAARSSRAGARATISPAPGSRRTAQDRSHPWPGLAWSPLPRPGSVQSRSRLMGNWKVPGTAGLYRRPFPGSLPHWFVPGAARNRTRAVGVWLEGCQEEKQPSWEARRCPARGSREPCLCKAAKLGCARECGGEEGRACHELVVPVPVPGWLRGSAAGRGSGAREQPQPRSFVSRGDGSSGSWRGAGSGPRVLSTTWLADHPFPLPKAGVFAGLRLFQRPAMHVLCELEPPRGCSRLCRPCPACLPPQAGATPRPRTPSQEFSNPSQGEEKAETCLHGAGSASNALSARPRLALNPRHLRGPNEHPTPGRRCQALFICV